MAPTCKISNLSQESMAAQSLIIISSPKSSSLPSSYLSHLSSKLLSLENFQPKFSTTICICSAGYCGRGCYFLSSLLLLLLLLLLLFLIYFLSSSIDSACLSIVIVSILSILFASTLFRQAKSIYSNSRRKTRTENLKLAPYMWRWWWWRLLIVTTISTTVVSGVNTVSVEVNPKLVNNNSNSKSNRLLPVPADFGKIKSGSGRASVSGSNSGVPSVDPNGPSSIQQHWNHQQCPSPDELIAPCVCNATKKEVFCRGSPIDSGKKLRQSFQLFAKLVPHSLQYYHSVYINLRGLVSLENSIFAGIRFNTIFLRGNNLTNIERDAFLGTEHFVQSLYIYGTNLSSQPDSKYNFFEAVKQLSHLQKLIINQNNLTEIPDRAFTFDPTTHANTSSESATTVAPPSSAHYVNKSNDHGSSARLRLSELAEIQISNGMIETIGSDAFGDLKHLANLGLTKNRIQTIRSHAFRMRLPSNMTLFIDLTENPLRVDSFEPDALVGSKRPLKIHLGLNGCTSSLQNLPEHIFRPFLDENIRNIIDVGRHCYHIECDCQMAWTLAETYTYRVKNFRCLTNNGSVYFRDYLDRTKCKSPVNTIAKETVVTKIDTSEQTSKPNDTSTNEIGQVDMAISTPASAPSIETKSPDILEQIKPISGSGVGDQQHLADVEFCLSKKCIKQGIEMSNYLNRSVDPCESFYDFACNGWENKHLLEYLVQVLSNGGSEFDNFVKVRLRVEENLEKLLTAETSIVVAEQPSSSIGGGSSIASSLSTYRNFSTIIVSPSGGSVDNDQPAQTNHHQPKLPINPVLNVKEMYVQCTTLAKGPNHDALGTVLKDIGGWPLLTKKFDSAGYRWEKFFPVVVNQYKDNIFIEIDASVNENSTKHLMIKAGSFVVSKRKLLSVKLNRLENYASYMLNTALHFGAQNNQNETLNEIWDVIRFEKQIANIAKKNLGNEHMIERKLETLSCLIPEIDWLRILFDIHQYHRDYHQRHYQTLEESLQFDQNRTEAALMSSTEQFAQSKAMYDVHFLIDLSRLLARTERRIVANYIGWRVIESVGFLIGGSAFVEIQQNFYSTESKEGTKLIRKQCMEPLVRSVPYLMARIYLEKHLPEQARNNARLIIEAVKGSFVQSMASKGWIDESKEGLMQKIDNIQVNIGYPDWILRNENLMLYYRILNYTRGDKQSLSDDSLQAGSTPSSSAAHSELLRFYNRIQQIGMQHMLTGIGDKINKSHYWDPLPLYVGASYDIVDNIIAIPMGLLQPPFYEDDRPFYLNFASLGSFFGHELSHSVTPRYTEFEKLLPPWTDHFLKVYLTKAQCFVSQYTSYYDKTAEQHLDGMRTFEEDMSDLAGIHAAFEAYQRRANNEVIQKLQELPEFSTDMLFFLSFAQKWCRSNSRVQTRLKISKSVHSPEKYRVNGALSNLEAFAVAYNCTAGTAMNPIKKCESW